MYGSSSTQTFSYKSMSPNLSEPDSSSPVIAIDGLSASGKGTLARRLAAHFGFAYLDTGVLYRAVALVMRRTHESHSNEVPSLINATTPVMAQASALAFVAMDCPTRDALMVDPEVRAEATATLASMVSCVPEVRQALLAFQRDFAAHPPEKAKGAVLDGRDIGTVVCPEACAKLFITASLDVRTERRFKELQARGEHGIERDIREALHARDVRDSSRSVAPAIPADDACVLDTSALDVEGVVAAALAIVTPKLKRF